MFWNRKNKYIPDNPGLLESPEHVVKDWRKITLGDVLLAKPKVDIPPEFFSKWGVEHAAKIEYFQRQPDCVAEASSRILGTLEYKETGQIKKPSPRAIMTHIKRDIEHNDKEGAWIESAPKSAEIYGAPFESQFPTDYKMTWKEFISAIIPPAVDLAGTRLRIKNYFWTEGARKEDIDTSIYLAEGNVLQGAVIGSNPGWRKGIVRPPKTGERTWGHSIYFLGYDLDYTYIANTWSWNYGMTLYLKRKGNYYVKGTKSNYDAIVRGVNAIPRSYFEQGFVSRALGYYDLPDVIAQKTRMLATIKDKNGNLYIKFGEKWFMVLDPETYNLLIGVGACPEWNVPKVVEQLPKIDGVVIGRDEGIRFISKRDSHQNGAWETNINSTANPEPIPDVRIES